MTDTHQFLVELGTEELPPVALPVLSSAFREALADQLKSHQLRFAEILAFATPRRLALRVEGLPGATPVQNQSVWGPPVSVAFDANSEPTKAAEAFAQKNGVAVAELTTANDGKVDKLLFETKVGGEPTAALLPEMVSAALARLPIGKRMRWGASREEFVRPVHWLVMLLDEQVVPGTVLGLAAGNTTRGHRFHAEHAITLKHANTYEAQLADAYVVADFQARRARIVAQVTAEGEATGGGAVLSEDLLDEVTALVEWPVAITGRFDERFLAVPPEALVSAMKEHQKYFHVVDAAGTLMPYFITVANIESTDVAQVIAGNEKVIRPRLADAAFFFESDKQTPLEQHREKLRTMVFQAKLGTLYDKTERIAQLAGKIVARHSGDVAQAQRAGRLSKADLVTSMVYEFADMQGIAGYYYALQDGESQAIATAITEQYQPKFAADRLPKTDLGTALALADRLDTLAGIFGLGLVPTGSKDPFALRRASVAVLRLLVENQYAIDLRELLREATDAYPTLPRADGCELALSYMLERMRAWYEELGIDPAIYLAVQAKHLTQPLDINARILAVAEFAKLPQAQSLAAANKRVSNLLAKQQVQPQSQIEPSLLSEPAEIELAEQLQALQTEVAPLLRRNDYTQTLASLARLREPVDRFFDTVLVMTEDQPTRLNRLALLDQLRSLFLQVADISFLAAAK